MNFEFEKFSVAWESRAFGGNPGNPGRKKLEAHIPKQTAKPSKTKLFALSDWPERIVLEFGQLNVLIDPKGNPVLR